jgi:hypothetical protein
VILTDEEELCRPENGVWTGRALFVGDPEDNFISVNIRLMQDDVRYKINHSQVLPSFYIGSQATYYDGDSNFSIGTSSVSEPEDVSGEISIDGHNVAFSGTANSSPSISISIVPYRYFSYSGIWNIETGEKN